MQKHEVIEGTVTEIVYQNMDNGYTVCEIDNNHIPVTVVGYLPFVNVGDTLKITGEWVTHQDYGQQFKAAFFEKVMPKTTQQILLYLSSGIIKGVGESTAKKIVNHFGENSLEIIRDEYERLTEIKGISLRKAKEISDSLIEKQSAQNVIMFLQQYNVSAEFALKVYKYLGLDSINLIKNDPYVLCEKISGIGFKTADKIAQSMGISNDHPGRIKSGIKYILFQAAQNGHTYLPKDILLKECKALLEVDEFLIENSITSMMLDSSIYVFSQKVYLHSFYHAELYTAKKLLSLNENKSKLSSKKINQMIDEAEENEGINLSQKQRSAVFEAIKSGCLVITGGPGTGKTTIIKIIISIFEKLGKKVALTAPTGRAAKRITEMCQKEAKTIHRLLEMEFGGDNQKFSKNESSPLDADVVIVDEASMVDILLMDALLHALKRDSSLILVGDSDQLPSVGAGNVLSDIINSDLINTVRLDEIYRQAQESLIIINAHRVNRGQIPQLDIKDKDFFFIRRQDSDSIIKTITDLCKWRLPQTYGYDPLYDIQVLCPSRKSPCGVYTLNKILQDSLNPADEGKIEKNFRDANFRVGDKVMQIRNNYNLPWVKNNGEEGMGVYNGDIGFIKSIDKYTGGITVVFDDERSCVYDGAILDELEISYAITVHKSQGSEFPVVIMPLYPCAPMLMNRNLFYTAITRAKNMVILVGREDCVVKMVENKNQILRYSSLKESLENAKDEISLFKRVYL